MLRILRMGALVICLLILTGCIAATGDMGEEMVYLRISDGRGMLDYAVMRDGELVKLSADGDNDFDFSTCKTGDVLSVHVSQLQETFPPKALYKKCERTGKSAEVELNESSAAYIAENPNWTIAE